MNALNKTQKLRLRVDNFDFYVRANDIRNGISPKYEICAATQKALLALEFMREDRIKPLGVAGVWEGYNVKIDIVK